MSHTAGVGASHEEELTEAQLDQVSGGNKDLEVTKTVDQASPALFGTGSPTSQPPPRPK